MGAMSGFPPVQLRGPHEKMPSNRRSRNGSENG